MKICMFVPSSITRLIRFAYSRVKKRENTILTGLAPFPFIFRMTVAADSLFILITRNVTAGNLS